jgi:hypothetical protein
MGFTERLFLIGVVFLSILLSGCSTVQEISKNLKSKAVNHENLLEGLILETSMSEDGSVTPRVKIANASTSWQTAPMLPGQGSTTINADYSLWTGSPTHIRITKTTPLGIKDIEVLIKYYELLKDPEQVIENIKKE